MQQIKYKAYSKELGMSDAITFEDLIAQVTDFPEFDIYLQYLGFKDCHQRELFEGDVLRLAVTEELMDPACNTFHNSNLGNYIRKLQKTETVTGFLLHLDCMDAPCRSLYYKGYIEINGTIERYDDTTEDLKWDCYAQDCDFPRYLCQKGAYYLGNTVENERLLLDRSKVR